MGLRPAEMPRGFAGHLVAGWAGLAPHLSFGLARWSGVFVQCLRVLCALGCALWGRSRCGAASDSDVSLVPSPPTAPALAPLCGAVTSSPVESQPRREPEADHAARWWRLVPTPCARSPFRAERYPTLFVSSKARRSAAATMAA